MLDQTTKHKIDTARQILVGKVPDPKAQVEQITTALIYKFMDDMDKESVELGGEPRFFTNGYSQYAWSKLFDNKLSGQDRLDLYVQALTNIPKNPNIPELFRNIFKGAFLPFRDPRTLTLFLKEINDFSYDHSENLGNAFEYLLSIMGSQGDAGQFRTPRHIIDFIVKVVDPNKNDTILDPACGTAGFLISAYKHILSKHDGKDNITGKPTMEEKRLTPDEKSKMMSNFVGYDISPDMVKLSLANLYLHGFPSPNIHEYDTLSDEKRWDETYDVILANPPFMTPKGGINPHKRFSIQANRAEVLFVDYIAEHLNINGRAGIIVPEGIIFQSTKAYKNLRKSLVENWGLVSVISLPAGVFQPYSGVKTSILYLDRDLSKKFDAILFIKIDNDGFGLGAQREKIEKNDLPNATDILKSWRKDFNVPERETIAHSVSKKEIAKNGDYNLTGDRYLSSQKKIDTKWPTVKLGDVTTLMTGGTPSTKRKDYYGGNVKWLVSGDIHKWEIYDCEGRITETALKESNARLLPVNSVLIALNGQGKTRGTVAILRTPAACNQSLVSIDPDRSKLIPEYLLYLLHGRYVEIRNINGANQRGGLNMRLIREIEIPLPPLETQREVVIELESYKKIVDGANQVLENWKPNLKIDPTWEIFDLGSVAEIARGGSPRPIQNHLTTASNGINWIKIGDVAEGEKYITKTKQKIKPDSISKTRLVKKGDFILSNSMSYGRPYIVMIDGAIHDGWLLIRINDESSLLPDYLYLVLSSDIVRQQYEMLATGGVVKNLNSKLVQSVKIPIPPIDVQKKVISEIKLEREIVKNNSKLAELFQQKIKDKIDEIWGKK